MSNWKECKIKEIGKVITGKTPSMNDPEDWGDEVLFITPSDYKNYRNKAYSSIRKLSKIGVERQKNRILPPKSVLVTCIGSDMGKTVISALPCVTNQQINAIIPNESVINSDYLYYSTVELYETLRVAGSDGTAVPILNKTDFENIEISLPPLPEQKAIAEVLTSLDDKIDLLHKQNKTLEQLAETLFRHHFIDNAQDDWEELSVGDVVSIKGGTTPSTKNPEYWNGDINWTSPRDLSNHVGVFLFNTERKITEKGLSEIGSGLMPVGTVLMSSRAPIGYLAISEILVAINQGYIAIVCDKEISNYFMFLWCKANMDEIKNAGNGSTFEEISKTSFKEMKFLMPSSTEEFDQEVGRIFEKIKLNQKQIRNLEKLREQLLPKLMNGEIVVKINERKRS